MKKIVWLSIVCISLPFIIAETSYADEFSSINTLSKNNFIANPQTTSDESIITKENIKFPKTQAASSINATVWMNVRDNAGKPALKKYWHVKYVNGKKYQGYVTWTGQKRLSKFGTGFSFKYQFKPSLTCTWKFMT